MSLNRLIGTEPIGVTLDVPPRPAWRTLVRDDNGVGASASFSPPKGEIWRVHSMFIAVSTDATVADRQVYAEISMNSSSFFAPWFQAFDLVVVRSFTASNTGRVCWVRGAGDVQGTITAGAWPHEVHTWPDIDLYGDMTVSIKTSGFVAGDSFRCNVYYEMFPGNR